MFELQEKLAYKELLAVRLYFNLGTYMGNNYLSCVITAQNALKNYPYSKYREEFMFYTIRAKYDWLWLVWKKSCRDVTVRL